MSLLATELANDTLHEVAATAAIATATIAAAAASTTKAPATSITTTAGLVIVGGVPSTATLGGNIGRGLGSSTGNLLPLLKSNKLHIEFVERDWLNTRSDGRHNGLEVLSKADEYERDELFIAQLAPS